jgi:uncharacterized protein YecE (DUF72 family)
MEFGKIQNPQELNQIDWRLPPLEPRTVQFLNTLSRPSGIAGLGQTEFYVGTPAWGHKAWIGKIYPPKTKPAEFLSHYAQSFNTIELNSSHYGIPNEPTVAKWRQAVPANFRFCPKLLQQMSHDARGLLDPQLQNMWYHFLDNLEQKRGPCFAQFPPHFDYSQKSVLFRFIEQWPKDFELALEFRHASWFTKGQVLPALTEYLQKKSVHGSGIGLVITDVAGRRDILHNSVSAPFIFLRWVGNDLHPSDAVRAQLWSARLAELSRAGMQKAYFIVHEPDDVTAPEMATTLIKELNEEAGADLSPPLWIGHD